MKLLVVTGTRADFGLWRPVLDEIERREVPELELALLVAGMHLDERFGFTAAEVRASTYAIAAEIACRAEGDSRTEMAQALGVALASMAPALEAADPDWVLLLGDRGEQLAAGLAALHLGRAIAHLHGGERTLGAVDDTFRDMISRLAHLHFVADRSSAGRLERLGEAPWRIHVTGAPGLDGLADADPAVGRAVRERLGLGIDPYAVVVYHPETIGHGDPAMSVDAVLGAVVDAALPAVAILPNTDAGGLAIRDALLARTPALRAVVASLPREEYVGLLAGAAVLVGNSSSGIIEAPLLRVPAVNVGDRQKGRLRGDNVLDVPADRESIRRAIEVATSTEFRSRLSGVSPYGSGRAAPRIVDALLAQPVDDRLLVKEVA
jgi:UDP-hydrolysing UDP-N-acetyl-D-glucosamine 2-epimerase